MTQNNSRAACASLVGVFAALLGCGDAGEPVGVVFGKVTLDGSPPASVSVTFSSDEIGVYRTANVDDQGEYGLADLPLGRYQVFLAAASQNYATGQEAPPKPTKIPMALTSPETSGLELTVAEGENEYDISYP